MSSKQRRKEKRALLRMAQQEALGEVHSGEVVSNGKPNGVQGAKVRVAAMRTELYMGQVPHPEHAERYEQLLPGCTDRFVSMAERQSRHRQWMEKGFMLFNGSSQMVGVVGGLVVAAGSIWACTYLIMNGKSIEGFGTMLVGLGAIVSIFVMGRSGQRAEIEGKKRPTR